jgi:hypothetical protein
MWRRPKQGQRWPHRDGGMSNYTAPPEFCSRKLFFSSLNTPKSVRHNFISRQNFSNLIFSWREFCHNGIARQQQPLRDLDQVRAFLSGAGPTAFLDMPWIPLFLIPLFLFIRQSVS